MIIDAHYHLDERMEKIDRIIDQMDQHGIDRVTLIAAMVDPFHIKGITEKLSNLIRKSLMSRWRSIGRLIYITTVTKKGQFSVLGKLYNIYHHPDNHIVDQAIKAYPDRFWGWIFVNPSEKDPIDEINQWVGNSGWIGVKCHPFWHRYKVKILDDTCAYCSEKGLPLLIHLGGKTEQGDYRYLTDRHSNLKIIYAHAGVPYYEEIWDYIKTKQNAFIDISSPYLDEPLRNKALDALGAKKCIYGSDGPFGYPDKEDGKYDHGAILSEIYRFPISNTEKKKILGENFSELVNL